MARFLATIFLCAYILFVSWAAKGIASEHLRLSVSSVGGDFWFVGINNEGTVLLEDSHTDAYYILSQGRIHALPLPPINGMVSINNKGHVLIGGWSGQTTFWNGLKAATVTFPKETGGDGAYRALNIDDNDEILVMSSRDRIGIFSHGSVKWLIRPPQGYGILDPRTNDSHQIVGTLMPLHLHPREPNSRPNTIPFIWRDGKLTLLNAPSHGDCGAFAINNSGQVVGFYKWVNSSFQTISISVIWPTLSSKMIDLNSLPSNVHGWRLQNTISINDKGQIVGLATIDGKDHGYLAKLSGNFGSSGG